MHCEREGTRQSDARLWPLPSSHAAGVGIRISRGWCHGTFAVFSGDLDFTCQHLFDHYVVDHWGWRPLVPTTVVSTVYVVGWVKSMALA